MKTFIYTPTIIINVYGVYKYNIYKIKMYLKIPLEHILKQRMETELEQPFFLNKNNYVDK